MKIQILASLLSLTLIVGCATAVPPTEAPKTVAATAVSKPDAVAVVSPVVPPTPTFGSATVTSPTSKPAAPAAQQAAIKQLVIGSLEEPGSLSALADLPHHFPEHVAQTLLFDSLTQFMPDGSVAPKLAEKWEISADNLTYTFSLVANAKFHDGKPVTADDVKFTFEAATNPETKSSDEGLDTIAKTEVVDPRTVKVTLKRVTPMFLAQGGARGIVPKHLLDGKNIATDDFNRKPVGSGPYKLVSFTPGQSIVLESFSDYYRGAANIQRVIFKIIPDQNVMLTQLRSGEIQYALITPRDLPTVQSIAGLSVVEAKTPRFFDITPNYQRVYWQDAKVREAVLTAIDRKSIVDKILLGHGAVMESNVSPVAWAFNPAVTAHPYDQGKAKMLLDQAGWTAGSDGIRAKAGQKLSFGVMLNNYDRTLEQALIVTQQNLKDVGVEMRIERVEPGVFGSRRGKKDYDALSRVWNPVYDPDQTGLIRTGNFYGYTNPQIDELSTRALSTLDRTQRKAAYDQVQTILSQDVARLFLYTENELHAFAGNVSGVQPHSVNTFWNIKDWKIGS